MVRRCQVLVMFADELGTWCVAETGVEDYTKFL